MLFPYEVLQLTPGQTQVWNTHFAGRSFERPRSIEEGIWRRTQNTTNRPLSGWEPGADGRRRVVHYRYQYEKDMTFPVPRLVLSQLYLAYSITAPTDELVDYGTRIDSWLEQGRWRRTTEGWARAISLCASTATRTTPRTCVPGGPPRPGSRRWMCA